MTHSNEDPASPLSQDQEPQLEIGSSKHPENDTIHQDSDDTTKTTATTTRDSVALRSLLSTKGAGVVIGKGGQTVLQLREETGARAGVSKVCPGVNDRVLTVSGSVEQVQKAFEFIAKKFMENPVTMTEDNSVMIRLLIPHSLMGSIIGRQGLKIKQIQDTAGVRMAANKEMLPQSNERIVEITGQPENISIAVAAIAKSIQEDMEKGGRGVIYYDPKVRITQFNRGGPNANGRYMNGGNQFYPGHYYYPVQYHNYAPHPFPRRVHQYDDGRNRRQGRDNDVASRGPTPSDSELETKTIPIPSDMVGFIIGRAGSKISDIRRRSGSRISISQDPNEEGERIFTCIGSSQSNEKAL